MFLVLLPAPISKLEQKNTPTPLCFKSLINIKVDLWRLLRGRGGERNRCTPLPTDLIKERVFGRACEKSRPSFTRRCCCSFCFFLRSNYVRNIFFKTELVVAAERYRIFGSHIPSPTSNKILYFANCFLGRLLGTFLWLRSTPWPMLEFSFGHREKFNMFCLILKQKH